MIGDIPPTVVVGVPVVGSGQHSMVWPEFPNNTKEALCQIGNTYFSFKIFDVFN